MTVLCCRLSGQLVAQLGAANAAKIKADALLQQSRTALDVSVHTHSGAGHAARHTDHLVSWLWWWHLVTTTINASQTAPPSAEEGVQSDGVAQTNRTAHGTCRRRRALWVSRSCGGRTYVPMACIGGSLASLH